MAAIKLPRKEIGLVAFLPYHEQVTEGYVVLAV
jgi:hypothetical protein